MSALMTPQCISPEELLLLPDAGRYELVCGRLVERKMGAVSDRVATRIISRLDRHCETEGLGTVLGSETGYRCFPDAPAKVRRPDVSFIAQSRLQEADLPEGYLELAPDLAVESVSPHELHYEVEQKVGEYLSAGVQLVWVANPHHRTVTIYRQDGSLTRLRGNDEITGEGVIPEFRCSIRKFFPPQKSEPEA